MENTHSHSAVMLDGNIALRKQNGATQILVANENGKVFNINVTITAISDLLYVLYSR